MKDIDTLPNLKYFSTQKRSSKANESGKCQENNQEEKDEEACFLCNEEECKSNAGDSIQLQYDKCNFWAQKVTEKVLHRTMNLPKFWIGMLKLVYTIFYQIFIFQQMIALQKL